MRRIVGWWYIPLVVLGGIFVLYAGLIGYRLIVADRANGQSGSGEDETNSFWSNLTQTFGIDSRTLKGERQGRVNVLLVGVPGGNHNGPTLTDTIMLVSADTKNKKLNMFSIPRDLYLEIPGFGYNKINSAYSLGDNYQAAGGGMDVLTDTVKVVLGQDINYYVKVDFEGFEKAVDLLGGVDVYVEEDIYDYLYPDNYEGYDVFSIEAGSQHLDGETALKYVRSRQTTSDFDRARRQQQVMLAMKEAFLKKGLLEGTKVLIQLIDVVNDHLETNIKVWEWERIAELAKGWGNDFEVENFVFDNTPEGYLMDDNVDGLFVLVPVAGDFEEINDFVEDTLSGKTDEETQKTYSFEVLNGTDRVGLAGGVAGELQEEGHAITYIGNTDENIDVSIAYCYDGKDFDIVSKYLMTSWNIKKIEKVTSKVGGADCQIILGADFN